MLRRLITIPFFCSLLLAPFAISQVEQIEQEGIERTAAGQAAQKKVDALNEDTRDLVDDYYAHLKLVQGLPIS